MRSSLLVMLLFISFVCNTYAGESSIQTNTSRIEGLNFLCESCLQIDDETCEFESLGDIQRIACNDLIERLLTGSLLKKGAVDENPSSSELGQFLIFKHRPELQARFALRLMLSRKNGRILLDSTFENFHSKYPDILEQEIRTLADENPFRSIIWNKKQFLSASTKASIVNSSKELSSEDFFETLSVVDIDFDIEQLKEVLILDKKLNKDFTSLISEAVRFLFACKHSNTCEYDVSDFPELTGYSKRVQANRIIQVLNDTPDLESEKIFDYLSTISYKTIRTPRMHEIIRDAYFRIDKKKIKKEHFKLVEYFSNYDSTLKQLLNISQEKDVKQNNIQNFKIPILPVAFAVFVFLTLVFVFFRYLENKRQKLGELEELRLYFGLREGDSIEKLNNSYRQKARVLHPDTAKGDARAFSEMSERYQQAKKLMGS